MRRQWAASEADDLGWGGVSAVALATGLARNTIMGGARELESRRAHPRAEVSPELLTYASPNVSAFRLKMPLESRNAGAIGNLERWFLFG